MKTLLLSLSVVAFTAGSTFAMDQCRHSYRTTMAAQEAPQSKPVEKPLIVAQMQTDLWLVKYLERV